MARCLLVARGVYLDPSTNVLPSGSLKIAAVPQSAAFGGETNSTPRDDNSSYVFSTLAVPKLIEWNEPMRSSCPSGVNSTTPVSAPGILSSIQRCLSLNG